MLLSRSGSVYDAYMWICVHCLCMHMCARVCVCAMQGLFIPKLKRTRAELSLKNTVAALKVAAPCLFPACCVFVLVLVLLSLPV